MQKLKNRIEAILYSAGKKVKLEEIAKLAKTSTAMAHEALAGLKSEYDQRDSSLFLVEEGDSWKIIVKDEYIPVIKKLVTETELSKTVLETLAVIAFKYPIKQADLIKIRTNKAYDHLKELEDMGYISRQKHGRSKLIKLTQKFFEYFDLHEEQLKEKFQDFKSIAKAIEEKESEIDKLRKEHKERQKEEKEKDEKIKESIKVIDDDGKEVPLEKAVDEENKERDIQFKEKLGRLDVFNESVSLDVGPGEGITEHLGNLKVVNEPSEEQLIREHEMIEKIKKETSKNVSDKKESIKKTVSGNDVGGSDTVDESSDESQKEELGVHLSKEEEEEVEKKVQEILHPDENKKEEHQEQKDI